MSEKIWRDLGGGVEVTPESEVEESEAVPEPPRALSESEQEELAEQETMTRVVIDAAAVVLKLGDAEVAPDRYCSPRHRMPFKLSVGVTCHPEILEMEGLSTQRSQPGRTSGESVGGIFEMDSHYWSN